LGWAFLLTLTRPGGCHVQDLKSEGRKTMTVPWETVHVFISSTFNDMHAERDYLVKQVFPELRDWCEKRKLRLVDIDLRWGVTEQDATSQNVVKVCLDRIDDCRPFFLCFLGQRRGWVPKEEEISPATKAEFPALKEYAGKTSVTEMEILHALVNPLHRGRVRDPNKPGEFYEPSKYAFFYLREDSYLDQLPVDPPKLRETYTNDGVEKEKERLEQNQQLKQWREVAIPATNRPVRNYHARWEAYLSTPELLLPLQCPSREEKSIKRWQDTWQKAGVTVTGVDVESDPTQADKANAFNKLFITGRLTDFQSGRQPLSQVIVADLQAAIAARFPDHTEVVRETDLQKEIDQQEQYLYFGSQGFIERGGDFDDLDAYVHNDSNQLFVLTAPGGMGKSSLLATWVDRYRTAIEGKEGYSIHFRFIGQSDRSTTIYSLLHLLLHELKEVAGKIPEEIPDDPQKLRQELSKLFELAGKKGKTVIMLDALNQLESGLYDLAWLPYRLPHNIKLIVSFKTGESIANELLKRMQGQVISSEVKPFENPEDRRKLVDKYLDQYLKQLDKPLMEALIQSPGASNPLYLKVVLSELRVFGAFTNLGEKIRSDFGETPVSAFDAVLRRLENDPAYSSIDPQNAVPLLFGLLAHARQGLSVEELSEIFSQVLEKDTQSTVATIHLYLRQVRPFLAQREDRYDFFFESFKLAAQARYVDAERNGIFWHSLLANYFKDLPIYHPLNRLHENRHKLAEQPYHQAQAEVWDDLAATLTDYAFLEAKLGAFSVAELVTDYDPLETHLASHLARPLLLIRDALKLSSTSLAQDKHQLAAQLIGRLRGLPFPEIERLLQQADEKNDATWLCPLTKSLRSPGSSLQTSLVGHTGRVTFLRVLRGGECVISGSDDRTIRVWDLKLGQSLAMFWLDESLREAVMDAHGRRLLAVDDGNTLVAWDAVTFQEIFRQGHSQDTVSAIAISPNGRWAAYALSSGVVRVWDLDGNKKVCGRQFKKPNGESDDSVIEAVSIPDDGTRFALVQESGYGRKLIVYDLAQNRLSLSEKGSNFLLTPDGRQVITQILQKVCVSDLSGELEWQDLCEHRGDNILLRVSSDSRWLITSTQICDLHKREVLGNFPHGRIDDLDKVAVMPDGSQVVYEVYRKLALFSPSTPEPGYFTLAEESVTAMEFLPGAKSVIGATHDHKIHLWNLVTNEERYVELLGHEDSITAVQITNDGRKVISASGDGHIKIWDAQTRKELYDSTGHTDRVTALALSSDDRWLASASFDHTVIVWDLDNKEPPRKLQGHSNRVWTVAISANGGRVVSGGEDNHVLSWDLKHPGLKELYGHTDRVNWVVITPDGQRAVSASADNTLRVWNLELGRELFCLLGHTDSVNQVALTPNGKQAISASSDGFLKVWNLQNGQMQRTLTGHNDRVHRVLITADGRRVISGSHDGTIKAWDLETGELLQSLEASSAITALALLADGRRVVYSVKRANSLEVRELESGLLLQTLRGHGGEITQIKTARGGDLVVSGSDDSTVIVWDLEQFYEIAPAGRDSVLTALQHHPAYREHSYRLEDLMRMLEAGKPHDFDAVAFPPGWRVDPRLAGTLPGIPIESVTGMCLTPDGWRLVCTDGGSLRVWDLRTWQVILEYKVHAWYLNVTPDGSQFITRSNDQIALIDSVTGRVSYTFDETHERDASYAVKVTPDGRSMVFTSAGNSVQVRELGTGAQRCVCRGHSGPVMDFVTSRDGQRLYTTSMDGSVRIWDLTSGAGITTLVDLHEPVLALALSANEQVVILGTRSKILYVDTSNRSIIYSLSRQSALDSFVPTPDGSRLLVTSGGTVEVWEVEGHRQVGELHVDNTESIKISVLVVTPDGYWAICASENSSYIFTWDLRSLLPLPSLFNHASRVGVLGLSADGQLLLSGANDRTLKLWDLRSRQLRCTYLGHTATVTAAAFLQHRIVSASLDHTIRIWKVNHPAKAERVFMQPGPVNLLVVSADGKRFVSASQDGTTKVWTTASWQEQLSWQTGEAATALALSADGKLLLEARGCRVSLWELKDGKQVSQIDFETSEEYVGTITQLVFAPDGKTALLGDDAGSVVLFDVKTGDTVQRWDEYGDCISALALLPDGKRFLIASREPELLLGKVSSGADIAHLKLPEECIPSSIQVVGDGSQIIVGLEDGRLLRLEGGGPEGFGGPGIYMLGYPKENFSILFTSRRQLLLNRESMIEVWDLLTGRLESAFIDDGAITSLKYLSKFNCLVCESKTGAVHLLELRQYVGMDGKTLEGQDLASQQPIPLLEEYKESVVVVTPTVEEMQTISVSLEKAPESVPDRVETGQPTPVSPVVPLQHKLALPLRRFSLQGHKGLIRAVILTPDGRLVISMSDDDTLKVWEIESGRLLHSLEAWGVRSFSVTPDGRQVVYISSADAITFVNLESGLVKNSIPYYFGKKVSSIAIAPDGKKIVFGVADGSLTVHDMVSGNELLKLRGHTNAVHAVSVTPDGKQVVSGSGDSTLKVWKLTNERPPNLRDWEPNPSPLLRSLDGHSGSVTSVAVTSDSQQVISGSWDKTIKVWDLASGSIIRSLEGHTEFVSSVVVTPDGKQIVSGSGDKTLRVWDLNNGKSQTLFENDKVIWSLYLSHDSRWVICGDELGRVWVFDLVA
jgi:WD40 repeat protein